MYSIEYTETDRFIYDNEIRPWLPERIFDAHTHLQIPEFMPDLETEYPIARDPMFRTIDEAVLRMWWKRLLPDSTTGGLILGTPSKQCDIKGTNKYLGEHVKAKDLRFSILVSPALSAGELEKQIVTLKPHGLKPYMCFSRVTPYNDSGICDIIPEEQIALADTYTLSITLHVAKRRGMADEDNLAEITRLVKAYPRCNFILAHCGRCFIAPNMEYALTKLPVAENLWFDTSAVCDIGVFLYLFDRYDRSRLLFGTDLVMAAGFRGSYVRMGTSWDWVTEEKLQRPRGQEIRATFAAYENLCATLHAAKFCKLGSEDLDALFYGNAARLFGF